MIQSNEISYKDYLWMPIKFLLTPITWVSNLFNPPVKEMDAFQKSLIMENSSNDEDILIVDRKNDDLVSDNQNTFIFCEENKESIAIQETDLEEQSDELRFVEIQDTDWERKERIKIEKFALISQILIGMGRDYTWGVCAYREADLFEGKIGAFWGQTLTQTGLTLLPTFAVMKLTLGLVSKSLFFMENRRHFVKTQLIFSLSSWSSIPIWNCAQFIGSFCGKKLGMNSTAAGYFSGVATGVAETIWQGAIVVPLLLNQPIELIEVIFNTLSGAVWQWVFQANVATNTSAPPNTTVSKETTVGLKIAGSVAMTTLLMTLLARWIKQYYARRECVDLAATKDPLELAVNDYIESLDIQEAKSTETTRLKRRNTKIYGDDDGVVSFPNYARRECVDLAATKDPLELAVNDFLESLDIQEAELTETTRLKHHNTKIYGDDDGVVLFPKARVKGSQEASIPTQLKNLAGDHARTGYSKWI